MADYSDKHDITIIWNPVIIDDFSHFLIKRGGVVVGKTSNHYFLDRDLPTSPVTAIDVTSAGVSGVGYFRIDGIDLTSVFPAGLVFLVRKSTANDGTYTVDNSTFVGGNTIIYTNEEILLSWEITGVNIPNAYFEIDGNFSTYFAPNILFTITGSTGNDGSYSVLSSTYTGGKTRIFTTVPMPDATVDGDLNLYSTNDGNILIPYTYTIIPVDASGNQNTGTTLYKTSPLDSEGLAAPENLYYRRTDKYNGMDLNWDDALDRNVKGYLIYRTLDPLDDTDPARPINSTPAWSIVEKTTGNSFKDNNIPLAQDPIAKTTFASYYVASYDIAGNVSAPSTVTIPYAIASIPDIRNILDYLSLNVYWGRPLPEDAIGTQAVLMTGGLYPSSWRLMGWAPSAIAQLRIEGYLVNGTTIDLTKNTTYQVALTSFPVLTIATIDQGNKYIYVTGDYTNYFTIGDEISVAFSTGNDQNFTIASIILAGGPQTRLEVNEAIPNAVADGYVISVESQWLQPEIAITNIPNYSEDATPPLSPINLVASPDPKESRLFLNWMKYGIENDFLNFIVELSYLGAHDIAVITGSTFKIAGDQTAYYANGDYIQVFGGSENNGYYTVNTATFNTPYTEIVVVESIPTSSPTTLGRLTNEGYWNIMGTTKNPSYTVNEIPLSPLSWDVQTANTTGDYFEILGDYRAFFTGNVLFDITGSTGNNDTYSVDYSTFTSGKTRIYTNEPVPSAVADGDLVRGYAYNYRVRAVDRSGNISFLDTTAILEVLWDETLFGPLWIDFSYSKDTGSVMPGRTGYQFRLTWNDIGEANSKFKQYIVYAIVAAAGSGTPQSLFSLIESEVMVRQFGNVFTKYTSYAAPAGFSLYVWIASEDWYGKRIMGPIGGIVEIVL